MPPKNTTARKTSDAAELRRQAEAKLSELKKKTGPLPATDSDTRRLVHELQVQQIELEMQNEELTQSRAEVEALLRQYTDLYDFAPVGYFTLARDGAIHQVNLAGANLLGVERSELIKRRFGVFVSVESRPAFSAFLERVFSTSESKETCEVALLKDGPDPLWAHMEATCSDASCGQREVCHAVVSDITERKRAEETLRKSNELYHSLISASPEAIMIIRTDGKISYVSPRGLEMYGYKDGAEVIGYSPLEWICPEDHEKTLVNIANAFNGNFIQNDQYHLRRKDGSEFYGEFNAALLLDTEKKPTGLMVVTRDITERKRAEEALRESERELKEAQLLGRVGNWEYDIESQKITWSDQAYRLYERDPVLGPPTVEEEAAYYSPKQAQVLHEYARRAIEEGQKFDYDLEATLPSGKRVHFSAKMRPVRDVRGRIVKLFGTVQDITERKKAEEALRLRVEQLSALSQASQAATTSLDLDQVLTEIVSLAGKVADSDSSSIVLVDETGLMTEGAEGLPGVPILKYRARKKGFTSWIIHTRSPAVVDEIGEDGAIRPRVGGGAPRTANPDLVAKGIKSFVGLPLIVEEHTVGVLYLHSLRPGTFHDQLTLLTTFASQAAIAIEKARLYNAVQTELAERKQAEEALQRERDTAQQYLDIAGVLMAALNTDGQITLINQKGCEILGYKESELIGRNWFGTCLSEDAREEVRGVIERLMAGDIEPVEYYENAVLTKSGAQRILAFHNAVIRNQASQITGILFSGEDITERKQAETELQASREAERNFAERLAILSETTTELSKADNLDALCRRAVELGRERLDFDRLAIWFIAEDRTTMLGTFGVDAEGQFTDERMDQHPLTPESHFWPVVQGQIPILHLTDRPLYLNGQVVGQGSHVCAALWDGEVTIGYLSVDNLLRQRPFSDRDCELIRLYASALGHLISLKRAEEEIHASEERFAKSFQSNPIATIIDILPEGRLLDVNETFLRLTGYSREEVIGKTGLELGLWANPEDRIRFARGLIEQQSLRDVESRLLTKSGESRHILASLEIIEIASQPHGLIMLVDITERKQAEEVLGAERNLLRTLINNLPDAIYAKDLRGCKTLVNRADLDNIGRPEADVLGKTDAELFSPQIAAQFEADDQKVLQSGQPVLNHEERLVNHKGKQIWQLTSKLPLKDAAGQIVGLVGVGHDITERKRAEETLRQSEAKYRSIFDNAAEGIFQSTPEGKFLTANPAMARILGFSSPEELIRERTDIARQSYVHPEQREEFKRLMEQQNKVSGFEYEVPRKDGSVAWVSETAQAVWDATGRIVRYEGIFIDITERKQAEEALARQAEELRQRNEELTRLYRASGSLISGTLLRYQDLAQTIVEIVQQEFGQSNCSLLVVQKDSNELVRLGASGSYADWVKYQNLALDGPGLIPLAIRTNKVVNVGDVHSAPDYVQGWEAAQSELAIPLKVGSDVIGAIDVQSSEPNAFSPDDERLMTVFAERAALALEHSRLNTQIEARLQQLTALRTVDMAISGSFDINLTLGVLLDQVTGQLGVHAVDILVFNATTQTFKFACERGFRTQMLQRTQLKFGAGYAWRAIRERRAIVVPDIQVEPDGLQRYPDLSGEQFVAYLGMPLIAKGQIKGVLEVFHREPFVLEKEWYGFLEMLAGQAAIAIDNAELFDRLQSSNADLTMAYDSTLEGWASALELRDKETEGHTRRVTELTIQLARALGVKENDMVHIYRGALLHDIGKVGVPDSIVLKPGPLTEDEWVIMRKHPQYAYNMLSPIAYLRLALDIPYCHHEKWDGTGYPRGLKGEQIPLAARIFAVVDVWDALTSDRPYRKAWTETKARQYIQEQAGLYFDPQIVRAFLKESFKKG